MYASGLNVDFASTRAGKKCTVGGGGPLEKGNSFPVAYAGRAGPAGNIIELTWCSGQGCVPSCGGPGVAK